MQRLEVLEKPLVKRRFLQAAPRLLSLHWRLYDALTAASSNLGLLLSLIDYELRYSSSRTHSNCHERDITPVCRWLSLVLTLVSVAFLLLRHQAKRNWILQRAESRKLVSKQYEKPARRFFSLGLGIELAVLMVFPYPYLAGRVEFYQRYRTVLGGHDYSDTHLCYTGGEFCFFFMFARLFFLLRTMFECVPYQSALATEVCYPHKVKANIRFSIKCLFKMMPMLMIVLLLACTLPFIAYLLRLAERPFSDISTMDFSQYSTSLWCTAVTMATIGYGDYYPYTSIGRLICALAGMWGAVMFSVVVFVIQDGMDLSKPQNLCFLQIRKVRGAALVVLSALRYNLSLKRFGKLHPATIQRRLSLYKESQKFERSVANTTRHILRRELEIAELNSKVAEVAGEVKTVHAKLDRILECLVEGGRPINC